LRPLAGRHARPRALVGGACGRDRRVDVRLVALGDDGEERAIVRARRLEGLPRPAVGELAVDEELIATGAVLGAPELGSRHLRVLLSGVPDLPGDDAS